MVNPEIFKISIRDIISQDYKLAFLGDDFDKTIEKITETKAEKIYFWVEDVIKNKVTPLLRKSNKKYKENPISDLMSFRKELKIEGNEHRIMLIKIKNAHYIEFHLGQHKYYDSLRKNLGLTK